MVKKKKAAKKSPGKTRAKKRTSAPKPLVTLLTLVSDLTRGLNNHLIDIRDLLTQIRDHQVKDPDQLKNKRAGAQASAAGTDTSGGAPT